MKISEVLRVAANKHLSASGIDTIYRDEFSCCAVESVGCEWLKKCEAKRFLRELGVNSNSYSEFNEFPAGPIRQSVRYCWLMFAAHVAEEEGL